MNLETHNKTNANDLYIVIKGGLGNQLFQIACGLQTAKTYKKTLKINKQLIFSNHHQNNDINKTLSVLKTLFPKIEVCDSNLSNLDFYYLKENPINSFTKTNDIKNCFNIYANVVLEGYFINYKYIPDDFYNIVKPHLKSHTLSYDFYNTYFIHIRLGDYLKHDIYLIDLSNYYNHSISQIKTKNKLAKFIVCTNQKNDTFYQIVNNFPKDISFIIQNSTDDEFDTLCLMSSCCGGVCSNSTFSYMGALFQEDKNKDFIYMPYPYVKFKEGRTKENVPIDMYPPWCTIYNTLTNNERICLKKNVFYINLEHRTDRKEHVERELSELGWEYTRFNAVRLPNNPALGCTLSHLKILEHAREKGLDYVVVVEDDICFKNKPLFLENLNKVLSSGKHFDVCLLSGNLLPPYKDFNEGAIQVSHSQTTTGYIVEKHYYETLINNIKTGANLLLRNPLHRNLYAIDMYWLQLQKKDVWIIIIPLTVTQIESYSDIEKKHVDYTKMMLHYKMHLSS